MAYMEQKYMADAPEKAEISEKKYRTLVKRISERIPFARSNNTIIADTICTSAIESLVPDFITEENGDKKYNFPVYVDKAELASCISRYANNKTLADMILVILNEK